MLTPFQQDVSDYGVIAEGINKKRTIAAMPRRSGGHAKKVVLVYRTSACIMTNRNDIAARAYLNERL
jgi:hypothetical protein